MQIEEIKQKIIPTLKEFGVEYAAVFGSVARGDDKPESDVDLLIRFAPGKKMSLLKYIGLQQQVSESIQRKVDLIEESGLHPYVRKNVIKDLKPFYGQSHLHLYKTDPRRYHFN